MSIAAELTAHPQTVFFGANDACLPGSSSKQCCPLPEYVQNLKDIVTHPTVTAHNPRIILITPPPINEYKLEAADREKGYVEARRSAENTRMYATACREVGEELGIAVLDFWSIVMAKTGWSDGEPLAGSRKAMRSRVLGDLFIDGISIQIRLKRQITVWMLNASPGLHFLPPAYKLLHKSLMELILQQWPDQNPMNMPFCLPDWTQAPR